MKKLFRKLFYQWYFITYLYRTKDGNFKYSNDEILIRNKIRSKKDIDRIEKVLVDKLNASELLIINWQHFE